MVRRISLVVSFIVLLSVTSVTSSLGAEFKDILKYPYKLLINRHFQKWTSTVLFVWSRYDDSTADAVRFNPKAKHYGADYNKWHGYKNDALIKLCLASGLKGMSIGMGYTTIAKEAKRFIFGEVGVSWIVWQLRKHYVISGNAFDFRKDYNEHLFVLPWFGDDRYVGVSGWKVGMIYSGITGISLTYLVTESNLLKII